MNPTIRQITAYLEDTFGKKIVTSDEALNDKMIAGPIPLNSLNDALFVISTVSNVDILRPDSSTILLKRR
ncbi:FecR domain-containing protein [Arcticibacter sp. MXS-1]|uniref:FecR domain-containing protein n=1 Tax=Arcticibacter sp. MXS-1 TaxID=3341726 RepID=UPI0035A988D6